MRLHRERRRNGYRCLTIELHDEEIDSLIAKGLLTAEDRGDAGAVQRALYEFFDQNLGQEKPRATSCSPAPPTITEENGESTKADSFSAVATAYIKAFDNAIAKYWGEERRTPVPHDKDRLQARRWAEAGIPVGVVELVADQVFAHWKAQYEPPPARLKEIDLLVRRAEAERTKQRSQRKA